MKRYGDAIAPNIFDGFADTQLLLPLVLGNLLSKKLWDLNARIQAKIAIDESQASANEDPLNEDPKNEDPLQFIRAIQKQLDRQFKHLHPNEVAEIYGEINLSDESRRLGKSSVDRALATIEANFVQRINEGSVPREALEPLLARMHLGYFPAFFYGNIDVVLANRALLGRKSSAPMGVTSCLDEVAIFASLAMTMPGGSIANVIALTSASHYTAFGWTPKGEPWWLYGKNKLYSRHDWSVLVSQQFKGNAQHAFDFYFKDIECVVCVTGTFNFDSGRTSISHEHWVEILEYMDIFFGVRLNQITRAVLKPLIRQDASPFAPIFRVLLGAHSLDLTRQDLLAQQDPCVLDVLYSYRSLALKDLFPYLRVARHQPLCQALGHSLNCLQDALDIVINIEGCDSIFNDRNRIAMPDETLRLKTGSDRDKALLLHILLEHLFASTSVKAQVETILTCDDTFVCAESFCFSLTAFCHTDRPIHGIIAQLSDGI